MTLNQVVNRLKNIAESHKQIKHFYFGDPAQWLFNGDIEYPAMFVYLRSGLFDNDNKVNNFDFEFYFSDLSDVAAESRSNVLEVFSDLTSIASDIINTCNYNDYLVDWGVSQNNNTEYFEDKILEDLALTVKVDVTIGIMNDGGTCSIPTTLFDPTLITENGADIITENFKKITT